MERIDSADVNSNDTNGTFGVDMGLGQMDPAIDPARMLHECSAPLVPDGVV